ncbi:hypothetical protein B0T25DRAFT_572878 [Lasiosphaeria hispida]|uniref:Uncharacterized protein n=1 Tax=Lasiosphaeria hispida TaxID=260671 RepID=A0AAJ0H8S0_9PEZI|nr:hypothetical protein B0T25DRAFT_572878 [Lasiosphaeria hispida]
MANADTRMTWDHKADHDLLTAMTQEFQPSQEQLRNVMARMHGFGYTCTVKAITQHLQKLRRKDGTGPAVKNGNGEASGSTPKSAKKRAAPTKKSSAKKTSKFVAEDDSEDLDSPSKRVKYEKVKKEKGVKKEESDEDAKDSVKKEDNSDDENDDFSF